MSAPYRSAAEQRPSDAPAAPPSWWTRRRRARAKGAAMIALAHATGAAGAIVAGAPVHTVVEVLGLWVGMVSCVVVHYGKRAKHRALREQYIQKLERDWHRDAAAFAELNSTCTREHARLEGDGT